MDVSQRLYHPTDSGKLVLRTQNLFERLLAIWPFLVVGFFVLIFLGFGAGWHLRRFVASLFGSKSLCFVSSPACIASTLHADITRKPNLAHYCYLEGFDASSPLASVARDSWLKVSLASYNPFS